MNDLSVYGPKLWHIIHTFSANYNPVTDRNAFIMFIVSISKLLPCPRCRKHFQDNLEIYKLERYLDSRDRIFLWSYIMHNAVNESQGKKSPPYKEVKAFFIGDKNCKV